MRRPETREDLEKLDQRDKAGHRAGRIKRLDTSDISRSALAAPRDQMYGAPGDEGLPNPSSFRRRR